jgi:hypothetical protein
MIVEPGLLAASFPPPFALILLILRPSEEVDTPGGQIHVEPGPAHFISMPLIDRGREDVCQPPGPASKMIHRDTNQTLGRCTGKVDHDEAASLSVLPAPRNEIQMAPVIRPPEAFTQSPGALQEISTMECVKDSAVKHLQFLVGRLLPASSQKHRYSDLPPVHLAFVD